MDDLTKLRREYSSLQQDLRKRQNMLNAYLQVRLPTGRGFEDQELQTRQDRMQRHVLADNSRWTSTPVRNQAPQRSPGHRPPSSGQRVTSTNQFFTSSRSHINRSPAKRKSDTDTPRLIGRGSSLKHHGSESKRLRSMETIPPRAASRRADSPSCHDHALRRQSDQHGREEQTGKITPKRISSVRFRESNMYRTPSPLMARQRQEDEQENVGEGSYVEQLLSQGNDRLAATRAREVTPKPRSILLTPGGRTKKTPMRVSFLERLNRGHHNSPIRPLPRPLPHEDLASTSSIQGSLHDRSFGHVTQPLLGYDWIAGLLDTDPHDNDNSNAYLEEIKQFRQLNREECVHTSAVDDPELMNLSQGVQDMAEPYIQAREHKCIHNYVLNDRLFAIPLHGNQDGESLCAICQNRRSSEKKSTSSPSYIRVSIPRSTLMSPYNVRPHRRQSFDPTDSMGLSQHCLAGWQNSRPSTMPPASTIDLKASLDKTMVAASSLFEDTSDAVQDTSTGRHLGPSRHTHELLNRSHALRVDLQRLERAGLSMGSSHSASRNYPLL